MWFWHLHQEAESNSLPLKLRDLSTLTVIDYIRSDTMSFQGQVMQDTAASILCALTLHLEPYTFM